MSTETADESEDSNARDAALMRQLALARRRLDGALRADLILHELLARHDLNIRRIVRYRTYPQQPADINEIVNTVMIRITKALDRNFDPEMPFGALVATNIEWAVIDWVRARKRRAAETSVEDVAIADPDADRGSSTPSLADEARRLRDLIASLPKRDREIVAQRMLFGLDPRRIAAIHGISRGAVDTATSRALRKLAECDAVREARDDRL